MQVPTFPISLSPSLSLPLSSPLLNSCKFCLLPSSLFLISQIILDSNFLSSPHLSLSKIFSILNPFSLSPSPHILLIPTLFPFLLTIFSNVLTSYFSFFCSLSQIFLNLNSVSFYIPLFFPLTLEYSEVPPLPSHSFILSNFSKSQFLLLLSFSLSLSLEINQVSSSWSFPKFFYASTLSLSVFLSLSVSLTHIPSLSE